MSQKLLLWNNRKIITEQEQPSINPFLIPDGKKHPALLIIPGGSYSSVCESSEGSPVAKMMTLLGFHAFVLHYRVYPHAFPAPLEDALRAMKLIRGNAEKWNVIPDRIAVCGFSAGAHLAGALGVFQNEANGCDQDEFDSVDPLPNGLILSYGVLSFAKWSHNNATIWNFCGAEASEEQRERFSLEKRVSENTPPAFIWHTFQDQMVSYLNSLIFANAMAEKGRPCELHVFPNGDHGLLLALDTPAEVWPKLAKRFLETQWDKRTHEQKEDCFTNQYQCGRIMLLNR